MQRPGSRGVGKGSMLGRDRHLELRCTGKPRPEEGLARQRRAVMILGPVYIKRLVGHTILQGYRGVNGQLVTVG
jgi:hypothetical protein